MKKFGIYKITNTVTGRVYVGQCGPYKHQDDSFATRKSNHWGKLRRGKHPNSHLQSSFDKHGECGFEFEILEIVDDVVMLTAAEQKYVNLYRSLAGEVFNQIGPVDSPTRGVKLSPEHVEKCRLANLGRKHTPESRARMGSSHVGTKRTDEQRDRMAASQVGRIQSELTRTKLAAINTGKVASEETKEKMRSAWSEERRANRYAMLSGTNHPNFGKQLSDETRAKISKSNLGRDGPFTGKKHSPESIEKMAIAKRGKVYSEESKAKMRASRLAWIEKNRGN